MATQSEAPTEPRRIVIAGASLAGLRAAQTLRDAGFDGSLIVIGAEAHPPYDRPPLSKQLLLTEEAPVPPWLEEPPSLPAIADFRFGTRAVALDASARELVLDSRERLPYDRLLVATGAEPRTLPGTALLAGVHTLRTIEESLAIRAAIDEGARVAVVGGGFIGSEVAAAARQRGCEVTLIEALPQPLSRAVGTLVGERCAALHERHGVRVLTDATVAGLRGDERVESVQLADGEDIPAHLVVVGIGVVPAVDWLASSGVELRDGVVCDQFCETALPGVFAAGDLARWYNPLFDEEMRVEHWTNAVEQGMAAATNMLLANDARVPFAPVPYVWSDQYDINIRIAGRVSPEHEMKIAGGELDALAFTAIFGRDGRLTGVLTFGHPMRPLNLFRRMIEARASWKDACATTF